MKSALLNSTSLVLVLFATCVSAQVNTDADEKLRLSKEREVIEQRFKQAEAACQTRFSVTSCVKEASKERAAALDPIRKQELAIRDRERKQQAQDQLNKLEKRKATAANKQNAEASASQRALKPGEITVTQRKDAEMRHAEKLKSAEEHREKVLQARKDRKKPPAAGLPSNPQ